MAAMRTIVAILVIGSGLESVIERSNGAEPAAARIVRVAAASDLKFAMQPLVDEFHRQWPAIDVKPTFGSSGNLFAQVASEAPFDVFLSADATYPRRLIEAGRARAESEFTYAIGQLVVWIPRESKLDLAKQGMKALADTSVEKLAIANPRHAPYGRAAEAALRHFAIYDAVAPRLVLGDNVTQAAQFVETGAADAGLIALSIALAPQMQTAGSYWLVPQESYPPIVQVGVVINGAGDAEASDQFRAFMKSGAAQGILKRFGFLLPGD